MVSSEDERHNRMDSFPFEVTAGDKPLLQVATDVKHVTYTICNNLQ